MGALRITVAKCCGTCKNRERGYYTSMCGLIDEIVSVIQVCDRWESNDSDMSEKG